MENSIDVVIVADYGDSLAPAEVGRQIRRFDKNNLVKQIETVNVPNFNTIATGFIIAQLGLHNAHENLVIFSNTAPRGKSSSSDREQTIIPWEGNEEQVFVFGRLKTGVPVFFVHTGFAGSAVKNELVELYQIDVPNTGTQFRSRDIYAGAFMDFLNGEGQKGRAIPLTTIPDLPDNRIAFIDGYGNIKTTLRKRGWPEKYANSDEIEVVINGVTQRVINRVDKKGERINGELYIQAGSSGGAENPFVEIVRIMGSAREVFGIEENYSENLVISFK